MPFVAGEGACPYAPSRAPGCGVHWSGAETLDGRSGRIRRRFGQEGHVVDNVDGEQNANSRHACKEVSSDWRIRNLRVGYARANKLAIGGYDLKGRHKGMDAISHELRLHPHRAG